MAAMNKIQDKLFLGNIKSASDLKMMKANVSINTNINILTVLNLI